MTDRRTFLRALLVAPAVLASSTASAQQMAGGAERGGLLDIRSDEERRIFADLECTCGCPREAISTCTCDEAAKFRTQVRGMMASGMTREQIQAEWVRRFGPQALMVPPNEGASRLLYIGPLLAIAGGAAFVVTALKRFRARDQARVAATAKAGTAAVAGGSRDEYDDKLDEELKQLDDE
jgi:cytochrome c-type biogenesis protein CcmH/NrfF